MIRPRKFRTQQARKRERVRVTLRVGALVCLCLLMAGGLVYVLRVPFARVQAVTVEVDGTLDKAQLASVAEAALQGTHFGILPRDSLLLPHTTRLAQVLRDAFPRIANATVERRGGNILHATIIERTPDALWCGDVVPPNLEQGKRVADQSAQWGTCYLVDATGYLYDRAPAYSDDSFLRYYGSLTYAQPIGQYLVLTDEYRAWQAFTREASGYAGPIAAFLFVDERDVELYRADGARILLPRTESSEKLLGRLQALYASDSIQKDKEVAYVDLRFGTKVFIKYVEEAPETAPTQGSLIHSTSAE